MFRCALAVSVTGLLHISFFAYHGLAPSSFLLLILVQFAFFILPFWPLAKWLAGDSRPAFFIVLPIGIVVGTWLFWLAAWVHAEIILDAILLVSCLPSLLRIPATFRSASITLAETIAICLLSSLLLLSSVLPTIGDTVPAPDGGIPLHTVDSMQFLGIVKMCLDSPRPPMPNFSRAPISYHFFMHYHHAVLARITALPPEILFGYWHRYIAALSLLLAVLGLASRWLASRALHAAAVIAVFGPHGLHTAWYWLLEFLAGRFSVDYYFYPIWGIRQFLIPFSYGQALHTSVIVVFMILLGGSSSRWKNIATGLFLALSSLFHFASMPTLLIALAALTFMLRRSPQCGRIATIALAAALPLALILGSGLLSSTTGRRIVPPTWDSMSVQAKSLGVMARWFGIELIAWLALLRWKKSCAEGDAGWLLTSILLALCPLMALTFNIEKSAEDFLGFIAFGQYLMSLPSLLIPLVTLRLLADAWSRGSIGRGAVRLAAIVWMIQLAGGMLNMAGMIRARPYAECVPEDIAEPLRMLERERGSGGVVMTNAILSSQETVAVRLLVPAVSGKPILLGAPKFFNLDSRPGYRELLDLHRKVFSSPDAEDVISICRNEGAGYIVEFSSGPTLHDSVSAALDPPLAATPLIRIFRLPR